MDALTSLDRGGFSRPGVEGKGGKKGKCQKLKLRGHDVDEYACLFLWEGDSLI
jgi:hypothetical protein